MPDHLCTWQLHQPIILSSPMYIIVDGPKQYFKNEREFYDIKLPLGFDYGALCSFPIILF